MDEPESLMRPVVSGWIEKIRFAQKARAEWEAVAEECLLFYSGTHGFMWEDKYQNKFWKSSDGKARPSPRFRMTIAKAFELVALFGPTLYHRNPVRNCTPRLQLNLPPDIFNLQMQKMQQQLMQAQDPLQAGMIQQQMQQQQMQIQAVQMQEHERSVINDTRSKLMAGWLNYTPNEQPYGGLEQHAELAITEALVKGRGVLVTQTYKRPGSEMVITGSFRDDPLNWYTDPDAKKDDDILWMAQKCTHPYWEVEREYGLEKDSLKKYTTAESLTAQGQSVANKDSLNDRANGKTNDLLTYYKIWSKMGIGSRMSGVKQDNAEILEAFFGDYCYMVVCEGCPFLLNLPDEVLLGGDDEAALQAAKWPVEFWRDNRWPAQFLDFYKRLDSTLPLAPMEPGIGELKFINIMVSHLCNRIWSSSRDFIAVLKSAAKTLKDSVKTGDDQVIIELEEIDRDINKVVQFLQQPQTNLDVWRILEAVMELFDKRVGLSDLLYGLNPGGTQPRSAQEVSTKQQNMSVRPDYMAKKVEQFLSNVARSEALASCQYVAGKDVLGPLGGSPLNAQLWDELISANSPDAIFGEMDFRVEAGQARRPNYEKSAADMGQVSQQLFQPLFTYGMQTGNVGPVNSLISDLGESIQKDMRGYMLPPPPPPMPPQKPNDGPAQTAA